MKATRFSIRYKFLLLISFLLVASVVTYLSLAYRVFSADKTQTVFDYNRSFVVNLSSELDKILESLSEKIRLSAVLLTRSDQEDLVRELLARDRNLAAFWVKESDTTSFRPLFWDTDFFASYGITKQDLSISAELSESRRRDQIEKKSFAIWRPSFSRVLPMALYARREIVGSGRSARRVVLVAILRLDRLGMEQGPEALSQTFIATQEGELLFTDVPDSMSSDWDHAWWQGHLPTEAVSAAVFRYSDPQTPQRDYLAAVAKSFNGQVLVLSRVASEKAFAVVDQFIYRSGLVASIFLTLAFLLAILFSRSLTKPLDRLMAAMQRVASGDLDIQIQLHSQDEIRVLAENFNTMTVDLKQSRQQLEASHRDLEFKVKERTRQLEEQNLAVKKAQEALLRTSRLAAAGEIAGRAAHEVLNPLTSILHRVEKVRQNLHSKNQEELQLFQDIQEAWHSDLAQGVEGLWQQWQRPSELMPGKTLLEEDLTNLQQIGKGLSQQQKKLSEDMDFLLSEGGRIHRIVHSMRRLNRTSGEKKLYNLGELLEESRKLMADSMDEWEISFQLDSRLNEYFVQLDQDEFLQAMSNLYRNSIQALRHRKKGEGYIRLTMDQPPRGMRLLVSLEDNGQGIAESFRERLFDGQWSTKDSSEGTGLGLSISRRFLRAFGGDLYLLDSQEGQFCRFGIELPLSSAERERESA